MNIKSWKRETIGKLCEFSNGYGFGPKDWAENGLPIIRIQNLNGSGKFNYYNLEPDPSWLVQPGTLLFAWAGTKGISFGPKMWNGPLGVLNQHIYRIHPSTDVDRRWLYLALRRATDQIERKAHGFKSTLLHVSKSDITNQLLSVPPVAEQRRIADILSAWDQALEKLEALIKAKEFRNKALMQQLLTGRKRLVGFSGDWPVIEFSKIFTRVTRTAKGTLNHVLSITAGTGFVDQREKFSRIIAGRNVENYILLRKGEFAYNKGNSDRYPQGCIYRLEEFSEGAVPNVWISFRLKSKECSPTFYKHFFLAGGLNHQLHRLINSGVRNDGLLNLTAENFFSVHVPFPDLDQQRKVGDLFERFSNELICLRAQRTVLEQQKNGLMQKLLTGEIRVKLEAATSE